MDSKSLSKQNPADFLKLVAAYIWTAVRSYDPAHLDRALTALGVRPSIVSAIVEEARIAKNDGVAR